MKAVIVHTSPIDGAETIECNGHRIQFGHGGGGDGFCYAHGSFKCVDNLSDEEKKAIGEAEEHSERN